MTLPTTPSPDPITLAQGITASIRAGRIDADTSAAIEALLGNTEPGNRLRLAAVPALAQAGEVERAFALCDELIAAFPDDAPPVRQKGMVAHDQGRHDVLAEVVVRMLAVARTIIDLQTVCTFLEELQWTELPLVELGQRLHVDTQSRPFLELGLLLVMLRRAGEADPYLRGLPDAVAVDPDVLIARAIAAVELGDVTAANSLSTQALVRRPFVSRVSPRAEADILVVTDLARGRFTPQQNYLGEAAYAIGNFPGQLQAGTFSYHFLHLQAPGLDGAADRLPPAGLIIANLSWGDVQPEDAAFRRFDWLQRRYGTAVINPPDRHVAMSRVANYRRWGGRDDFIFPRTEAVTPDRDDIERDAEALADRFRFPFILRLAFTQKGGGMRLVESPEQLRATLRELAGQPCYAIDFHPAPIEAEDVRVKYRFAVVDGATFAMRRDVNESWMVHRGTYSRAASPPVAVRQAEARFIENNGADLPAGLLAAVDTVARTAPLDIFGIDCGMTEDGRPIIYEANALMKLIGHEFLRHQPAMRITGDRVLGAIEAAIRRRLVGR
ncbi:MAG: hypothetical protein RLO50_07720 [Azospirillaceae bacterium]